MILANGTFFINDKPAFINGQQKFPMNFSWVVFFSAVSFNKVSLFSKDHNYFCITCYLIVC